MSGKLCHLGRSATKSATNSCNIMILFVLNYLEGVVAHGRASSSLAFGTIHKKAL